MLAFGYKHHKAAHFGAMLQCSHNAVRRDICKLEIRVCVKSCLGCKNTHISYVLLTAQTAYSARTFPNVTWISASRNEYIILRFVNKVNVGMLIFLLTYKTISLQNKRNST